jgi:hypothetical protein
MSATSEYLSSATASTGRRGETLQVFVSYRRDEASDATDRLTQSLRDGFGEDGVFLDVDNIDPGADFKQVIGGWVAGCDVLLVVIGPSWHDARDSSGERRLEDPGDYVRLEVEAALQRDVRVVPVLIHGAQMPPAEGLPPNLMPLLQRQAVDLSRKHFDSDVDDLIARLARITPRNPARGGWTRRKQDKPVAKPPVKEAPRSGVPGIVVAGYILAFFIPVVGFILGVIAARRPDRRTSKHGVWIIVVSVVTFAAAIAIIASAPSSESSSEPTPVVIESPASSEEGTSGP